jgi:multidrug resistance efflux pump
MTTPFSRSLRAIEGDGGRFGRWLLVPSLVVLGLWGAWMARADVPLHAASPTARLIRERAVYSLQSTVDGSVRAVHALLDQSVRAGDVLLELDTSAEELALTEQRARAAALEGEIVSTRALIAALEKARVDAGRAADAAREESALELAARRITQRAARDEADRLTKLEGTGDVASLVAERARTEAEKAEVAVRAEEAVHFRRAQDALRDDADRAGEIAVRRTELAELEGRLSVHASTLQRLQHALELRTVRAPVTGIVADLARLAPGTFVRSGETLGSIVAESRLAVEAEFDPREALGRVRLGQHGELALTGFPRAQYGVLDVEVERIASEARDGKIRVELKLLSPENARIPVEHGLPGELRIEVGRTSPFGLVLRSIGGSFGVERTGRDG